MASPTTDLTNRPAPAVMQNPNAPLRSRLPAQLKLPLLVLLNFCINAGLWEGATNFLDPELGAVSKVPGADELSLYSPYARLAMRIATIWLTWFFKYDGTSGATTFKNDDEECLGENCNADFSCLQHSTSRP